MTPPCCVASVVPDVSEKIAASYSRVKRLRSSLNNNTAARISGFPYFVSFNVWLDVSVLFSV